MEKTLFVEGTKYIITTDAWFVAPDGKDYRAVWGTVKIVEDTTLGIKTNRNATNWYAIVGEGPASVIVAGCQIHYAVQSPEKPHTGSTEYQTYGTGSVSNFSRQNIIWLTE